MARLSARGRAELARVFKEIHKPDIVPCTGCDATGKRTHTLTSESGHTHYNVGEDCSECDGKGQKKPLTMWERKTYALMSDRNILQKTDVRFQPDTLNQQGQKHTYSWTVKGKVKVGVSTEEWVAAYIKAGFTEDK